MALIPQAIEDRLKVLEDTVEYIEEKIALLEEALAPAGYEDESIMVHEELMEE